LAFLETELSTLGKFFPELNGAFASTSFDAMESPGNPAIEAFRAAGGPALLIPKQAGGRGATPIQAVRVQRALGCRSPSLAVAATMHHFSVASPVELAKNPGGMERVLVEQIARQNLYVASGVAEGRTGTSVLQSGLRVRRVAGGVVVSGSKKPCSLSRSMALLTASLQMPAGGPRAGELAFAVIPAQTPGIERRPFWKSPILAGAESDEIVLDEVEVPDLLISVLDPDGALLAHGFLWFELLISASYLGIADGLVAAVLDRGKGGTVERAALAVQQEAAMAALEAVAQGMMAEEAPEPLLVRALCVRFAVQQAIERTAVQAAELLGGLAFIESSEVACRYAAVRMLAFHPPSRLALAPALNEYLRGGRLVLG
jgi:alkylation response protein AidB-like acyl-CoA dehydrogenase